MKSFRKWLTDNGVELPNGNINGEWFAKRGLPMIVHCTCCEMTMALPSAYIDDEGYTYCSNCKGDN